MAIDKIFLYFKNLGLDSRKAFEYFFRHNKKIKKIEFLKLLQSFSLNFSQDELTMLGAYFDFTGSGDIILSELNEKFENITRQSLNKIN